MDFFTRFTREKTPQNTFSSQNFSVENNYLPPPSLYVQFSEIEFVFSLVVFVELVWCSIWCGCLPTFSLKNDIHAIAIYIHKHILVIATDNNFFPRLFFSKFYGKVGVASLSTF